MHAGLRSANQESNTDSGGKGRMAFPKFAARIAPFYSLSRWVRRPGSLAIFAAIYCVAALSAGPAFPFALDGVDCVLKLMQVKLGIIERNVKRQAQLYDLRLTNLHNLVGER